MEGAPTIYDPDESDYIANVDPFQAPQAIQSFPSTTPQSIATTLAQLMPTTTTTTTITTATDLETFDPIYEPSLHDFSSLPPEQQSPEAEITIDTTTIPPQADYYPPPQQPSSINLTKPHQTPLQTSQRESLKQAFKLTEETWAYDFIFQTKDTEVASLVMNPNAFHKSCYAEVNVQAMDVEPRNGNSGLLDFQHSFNWLLVPGFNRDGKVAGVVVSETVEDTDNISQSMPKNTLGRFIRDDLTSEMLLFTVTDSGDAKVIWLKNTAPYRQERKYFRLKFRDKALVSTEPDDILYSVICEERVQGCFKCGRMSGDCDCVMSRVLKRPSTMMDFDVFQNNLQVHDGTWFGNSMFYMKVRMGGDEITKRLTTTLKSKGFGDFKKKRDMTIMVQKMWLRALPMCMNIASQEGTPMVGWRELPEPTEAEMKVMKKKLRNRMSAARSNEKRRLRNLSLKQGLKEVKDLKPRLEQRLRTLFEENQQLKAACIAAGKLPLQRAMHRGV